MSFKDFVPSEVKRRAGHKSRISACINILESKRNDGTLTLGLFEREQKRILKQLDTLDEINGQISDICDEKDVDPYDEARQADIQNEQEYCIHVNELLASLNEFLVPQAGVQTSSNASNNDALINAIARLQSNPSRPKLQCAQFSGSAANKLAFKDFITQFNNSIDESLSGSVKLTYLRSYLTGYAYKIIAHLSISDANYPVAISLLESEFLDIEHITDEYLKQIINSNPKFDSEFEGLRQFLNETRAALHELKGYNVDLLEEGTAGNKLYSHIIFGKLPNAFKRELVHKVNSNYPTINQLFANYQDIIKTLARTSFKRDSLKHDDSQKTLGKPKSFNPSTYRTQRSFASNSPADREKPTVTVTKSKPNHAALENFQTQTSKTAPPKSHCKFCNTEGHSMMHCTKFATHDARVAKCRDLNLCELCTGSKHTKQTCAGSEGRLSWECRICHTKSHISALCPEYMSSSVSASSSQTNICINSGQQSQDYILPVVSVLAKRGRERFKFNCLVDSGSQRSYVAPRVIQGLNIDVSGYNKMLFDVSTFLGEKKKELTQLVLELDLPGRSIAMPMLVDSDFNLEFNVTDFGHVVSNLKNLGFQLAADFDENSDLVRVDGLIGVDLIQYMQFLPNVKCMNGIAWQTPQGIIPFGNALNFLHTHQITPAPSVQPGSLSYNSLALANSSASSSMVNFVLNPKESYPDPLAEVFNESLVERNIDNMFSCESLGIADDNSSFSNYDDSKMKEFAESIEFKDNSYHVKLPWHEDKISSVPSNHDVALSVLNRVVTKLGSQGLWHDYENVFKQQEEEGIIERFDVNPQNFSDYVWIPHRPVIKTEQQNTTKIRPVFNCSLKTKGRYSLNEAAYPGVNLMADMLDLLLKFRCNKYVMLADIRKAFLMIKLKDLQDRNRFCFFMKEGDRLVCFRYTTIIFGFNASPFILNFVIKHHASKFPNDECTKMLMSDFYVDNLVKTSNSTSHLSELYLESLRRMEEGNFHLRSWNTNSKELLNQLVADNTFVQHGCELEKVLGYKYSTSKDTLQLSDVLIDPLAKTKRSVLSQTSKVFDPLSLCLPVTVRGKMLLRDLWSQKKDWDSEICSESQASWTSLSKDLSQLPSLEFPRPCIDTDMPSEMFIFCDASKQAYGFCAYNVQNGKSTLVFAKAKVAPMKAKSLPTLELLSAFLSVKCLPTLLKVYSPGNVPNVTIAVDAQVVLSWLLSGEVKSKNQFAKNRLKDIHQMLKVIQEKDGIQINFKYIPTESNPADLVTRGLTFNKFQQRLDFWLTGPAFLTSNPVIWPSVGLECLSPQQKSIVCHNVVQGAPPAEPIVPVVPFDRYSSLNKLISVTSQVFQVANKFRAKQGKELVDPKREARVHLLSVMQQQCFSDELTYLRDPKGTPPKRVRDLNLFLDKDGIVRSSGRIGKNTTYEYEVINPILIAKEHPLTTLIITDCHLRCKHLGVQTTLNKVRLSGFWIPKARQSVKKVISKCFMCKKFNGLCFKYPKVTNLPKHRVNLVKPFRHTGVDYTGHIWVKSEQGASKMYLLIFTCLNIRAVHIELVPDMSTQAFILAFIRFTNIYGIPSHIYSDNAKSFIAGCNLLDEVFTTHEFKENFDTYHIKHIKIPLYAPWVGSIWERMIRTIKACLFKAIGRARIEYFDLLTVLSDIQNAINARPLTYRCSDSDLEVITPNSFLKPLVNSGLMLQVDDQNIWESDPPSRHDVIDSIETRDGMVEKFRHLWHETYLLSLREQCRDLHEVDYVNHIKLQDVVLVKNPAKSRPYWLLGRVVELIYGDDGKVRSAKIKRGDGAIQTHALCHLYPLELTLTHALQPDVAPEDTDAPPQNDAPSTSPGPSGAQMPTGSQIDDLTLNGTPEPGGSDALESDSSGSRSGPRRPRRSAASRGRQHSHDDPYVYY